MFDLLQTPSPGTGSLWIFGQFALVFLIFYFLLIAPMRKKQKRAQENLAKLKKGDDVILNAGIFGRITNLEEGRGFVVLQIADNVKIKVARSAIAGPAEESESAAPGT
ncbi:MAG TPA: preprotein translocase subunit YajC [Thermoanaerobaculia bacterium]